MKSKSTKKCRNIYVDREIDKYILKKAEANRRSFSQEINHTFEMIMRTEKAVSELPKDNSVVQ